MSFAVRTIRLFSKTPLLSKPTVSCSLHIRCLESAAPSFRRGPVRTSAATAIRPVQSNKMPARKASNGNASKQKSGGEEASHPCMQCASYGDNYNRPKQTYKALLTFTLLASHQAGSGTEGKHEWKQKPPYSINVKDFEAKLEASCHCGKIKYELNRDEPLDSKLCHCTTCQKQHAAPFQWAAIFHK